MQSTILIALGLPDSCRAHISREKRESAKGCTKTVSFWKISPAWNNSPPRLLRCKWKPRDRKWEISPSKAVNYSWFNFEHHFSRYFPSSEFSRERVGLPIYIYLYINRFPYENDGKETSADTKSHLLGKRITKRGLRPFDEILSSSRFSLHGETIPCQFLWKLPIIPRPTHTLFDKRRGYKY